MPTTVPILQMGKKREGEEGNSPSQVLNIHSCVIHKTILSVYEIGVIGPIFHMGKLRLRVCKDYVAKLVAKPDPLHDSSV